MQGSPCYARLFADLTHTPQGAFSCPFGTIHLVSPNPIKASGGQSRAPPVAGGARRKPSEQGSVRKAPRADAARPLRTALRPPNPRGFFDRLSRGRGRRPPPLLCARCARPPPGGAGKSPGPRSTGPGGAKPWWEGAGLGETPWAKPLPIPYGQRRHDPARRGIPPWGALARCCANIAVRVAPPCAQGL